MRQSIDRTSATRSALRELVPTCLTTSRRRRVIAALGTVAAAVLGGGGYAWAASGISASTIDTFVSTSHNINLSTTGHVVTPILTVTLPTSRSATRNYVLEASGDFVNFGPSDYTRCAIAVNGTETIGVAAMVGDGSQFGAQGPGAYVMPWSLKWAVSLPPTSAGPATADVECAHDNSNGAGPYVDAGASLWVHKTASLSVATE